MHIPLPHLSLSLAARTPSPAYEVLHTLSPRDATCGACVQGGTIAGIVLGTFFGTLLLVYFFSSIYNITPPDRGGRREVIIEERKRRRRTSGRSSSRHSEIRRPSRTYSRAS